MIALHFFYSLIVLPFLRDILADVELDLRDIRQLDSRLNMSIAMLRRILNKINPNIIASPVPYLSYHGLPVHSFNQYLNTCYLCGIHMHAGIYKMDIITHESRFNEPPHHLTNFLPL